MKLGASSKGSLEEWSGSSGVSLTDVLFASCSPRRNRDTRIAVMLCIREESSPHCGEVSHLRGRELSNKTYTIILDFQLHDDKENELIRLKVSLVSG